ncbi:hypothetical protein R83H12_03012 [Fibrobacteria bacterium R8-3-H12]
MVGESCLPIPFEDCSAIGGQPVQNCPAASSSSAGLCAGFANGTERTHYGTSKPQFCDERDGTKYVYKLIGEQYWMAENLNYDASGSKCYDDDPANCQIYGRAYNWATAKKACPSGWHLPSNDEWDALYHNADGTSGTESPYKSETAGKYLKAKSGWNDFNGKSGNGLDRYGFAALPGGSYYTGKFQLAGDNGYWWSATEGDKGNVYYRFMLSESDVAGFNNNTKSLLLNVRCVKD